MGGGGGFLGLGGGGGNITYNVPQPAAPAPIDYDKMYAAATRSAIDTMREQGSQIERLAPTLEGIQFNTLNRLRDGLDNHYLRTTRHVLDEELDAARSTPFLEQQITQRATDDLMAGPSAADRQIQSAGLSAMGVRADQVSGPRNIREVSGARAAFVGGPQAAMARNVANVSAGQVGAGRLGDTLMAQAMQRAQSGGRLSAEASRDAVQSARAGMAARGMATGSAGLAAELLNRDRFARARQAEDLAFAQGVQEQDVERQFANVANRMRADQGNQDVAARMALSDQAAQNQMALAGYQGSIEQLQAQAARDQQAGLANQQRDQVLGEMAMRAEMANQAANQNQLMQNRAFMLDANAAFLGAEDRRRANALGANQLDLARRQRRLGLAGAYAELDPYARATGPAFQVGSANTGQASNLIGQTFGNALQASGNVASFNQNLQGSLYNSWQNNNAAVQSANMQSRALGQSGMMGMLGGIGSGAVMGVGLAI